MNYLEIIGKNLVDGKNAQDYIDWAVAKLENGFETESIIALVSLILESFPEIGLAEKYFHASIDELGLPYPDSKKAIFAYLQFFCDEVLGGKIQPELAVNILKNICETISDNTVFDGVYHPIMDIWYYLDEDLYMLSIDEFSMFNIGLNLLNIDGYILQVIHQFQYIFVGSLLMWLIVSIIGYLVFTGSLPTPLWKLLSDWFFYAISVFAGCCYWVLLKVFSRPSFTTHDNVDKTDY